jgi:hypothetical protein
MTRHSDDTINITDLETPIIDAAHLARALETFILQPELLDDLSESEQRTVMETLAERLVRETKTVHEMFDRIPSEVMFPRAPLKAVTSGDK